MVNKKLKAKIYSVLAVTLAAGIMIGTTKTRATEISTDTAADTTAADTTGTDAAAGADASASTDTTAALPANDAADKKNVKPPKQKKYHNVSGKSINGHDYLTENSDYRLYVRKSDLSLVMEDKKTGAFMESSTSYDDGKNNATWQGAMRSAVVLTLINENDDTKQADLLNDDVQKNVNFNDNGFSAELYWTKYQLGFTMNVELTDDGLTAEIPEDSIKEDGNAYYIGTVTMYPYLGNSYLDKKQGYMFIPDGNGALVYLNDKEGRYQSGYSGMIYGSDTGFVDSEVKTLLWDKYNTIADSEKVMAPIYGIAHTDDQIAFLGIVEDGADRASIDVMPNGVSIDYNRAYARFTLRKMYTQPTSNNSTSNSLHIYEADRSHSDLKVRFLFLSGDKANYAGMAGAYRDYLIKNGELVAADDNSYRTRVDFLGTERKKFLLGTTAVKMTTTDDIRGIYKDLGKNGVSDILSVYKGWQKGGLWNLPITKYKADSKIGGTNELTNLIKDSEKKGIKFYLYNNALIINPDEQNATFNVVKKVNKRRYEEETYKDVYEKLLYLTPMRTNYLAKKFADSYTKKGVKNVALAGVTDSLYTFTYGSKKYTRFDTAKSYQKTIDTIAKDTNTVLESPFASYWKDTDAFLDMPLYTSSYILEDKAVPFLSIVLKGVMPVYGEYVNFEANKQEFLLKMIETGTYPSFYITEQDSSDLINTNSNDIYSSQYGTYKDTIISYDKELKAFNQKVEGATIDQHDMLDNDITRVKYSNGVTVYLNYGEKQASADGVTVEPMSYKVVE